MSEFSKVIEDTSQMGLLELVEKSCYTLRYLKHVVYMIFILDE